MQPRNLTSDNNDFATNNERDYNVCVDEEDTECGIGFFKPRWLRKYATPRNYLILYSIIGILQGSYYSYFSGCMTTLEKRFAFPSKISGFIMMVADVSPLFLGVLVGYFGGRSHMPRIISFGMFVNVVSCFVTALPYFIYGPSETLVIKSTKNETGFELCELVKEETCDDDDRPPTTPVVIILLFGSLMEGFGGMTYYAVGLAYMDDNAKKRNTPVYFAIAFALRLLGPTMGYLMSSAFLKIPENPFEDPGYGPEDPRWIGGWWMGFLVQGFLLLIVTIPMAFFPRRLPSHRPLPQFKCNKDETFTQKLKGLIPALKRLVKNPLFWVLCFNTVMSILGSFGHYVMLPKYMEYQFRLTASDASLYSGPPGLIAIQVATLVGGFCIFKLRPSAKFLVAGQALSELIVAIGFLILMIPTCEKVNLYNIGLTADSTLNIDNSCNADCDCSTSTFTPICGPDGRHAYFSPCHAGCTEIRNKTKPQLFHNCSCVVDHSETFVRAKVLEKGYCVDENCWSQALAYIIILPVIHGITGLLKVAHTMVFLRSVDPEDKSVALGAFQTFVCLFGFVPYPLLFGALVDSACLVWEKSCGRTGNCWFYDMDKFNYMLHGFSATFSLLSALGLVVVYFLSDRLRDLYEDQDSAEEIVSSDRKKEMIKDGDSSDHAESKL